MKSKTIILSSTTNTQGRGILTLYEEDELLKCKLRLYNLKELNKFCKLGIYHNNQVYSANLLQKQDVYLSSFVGDFDMDKDFYSAIINTNNNNEVIVSGGTYAGYFFNADNVFETNEATIDQPLDECSEDCNKCEHCKYKEFFYSNAEVNNETKTDSNESVPQPFPQNVTENKTNTIQNLLPQFKYIFENYQSNTELTQMLPFSRFVKINENNEEFSIGAIYENDEIKYLCYAVKCNYNTQPPQELGKHYQWLPLDKEDPLSEGYYIVFQDAKDLKIVEF